MQSTSVLRPPSNSDMHPTCTLCRAQSKCSAHASLITYKSCVNGSRINNGQRCSGHRKGCILDSATSAKKSHVAELYCGTLWIYEWPYVMYSGKSQLMYGRAKRATRTKISSLGGGECSDDFDNWCSTEGARFRRLQQLPCTLVACAHVSAPAQSRIRTGSETIGAKF
jgi:hypothetical protein